MNASDRSCLHCPHISWSQCRACTEGFLNTLAVGSHFSSFGKILYKYVACGLMEDSHCHSIRWDSAISNGMHLFTYCICVWTCGGKHMPYTHVAARGQLLGVSLLLPSIKWDLKLKLWSSGCGQCLHPLNQFTGPRCSNLKNTKDLKMNVIKMHSYILLEVVLQAMKMNFISSLFFERMLVFASKSSYL